MPSVLKCTPKHACSDVWVFSDTVDFLPDSVVFSSLLNGKGQNAQDMKDDERIVTVRADYL